MRRKKCRPGRISIWTWLTVGGVALGVIVAAAVAAVVFRGEEKSNGPFRDVEFRLLVCITDDDEAMLAATEYLGAATADPARRAELRRLAEKGEPPPYPGQGYGWVETAPSEARTLGVTEDSWPNPNTPDDEILHIRKEFEDSRENGEPLLLPSSLGRPFVYARPCENLNLSAEERGQKKYDYFLLARLPEAGKELNGDRMRVVKAAKDSDGKPCLSIEFTKEGGDLLYELTSKSAGYEATLMADRHLALIIAGKIISSPAIRCAIRTKAQISGKFTEAEVDAMVAAIRGIPPKP